MTTPLAIGSVPGRIEPGIHNAVKRMKTNATDRDVSMRRVLDIRRGDFASIWPEDFSDKYKTSIIANFVDVACRDFAAQLAPLPSLISSAGNVRSNADKRRAEKRNRIGMNYWRHCDLEFQMKYGADQYLSYGFLPMWVEADWDNYLPFIHVEDPQGAYYELDRYFNCRHYARVWRQDVYELAVQFPEYRNAILRNEFGEEPAAGTQTEVVRWIDDEQCILYLPEKGGLVLGSYFHGLVDENGKPECPVWIACRPGVESDPRGQFDDVVEVQRAAAMMAALTLEAGHKSVQAPLAVPSDVQEIPIGPDAVIVTDMPEKVARIPLNVPNAAFALGQQLQTEMQAGAGYPPSRMGQGPAGGSTGRGISALEGGFDGQIKQGQDVLGLALRRATEKGIRLEKSLWPTRRKTITGTVSGESFQLAYAPATDLAGNTQVEVSYGFAAGLSPNAAIVTMLQLRGDQLIGRDTVRRNLPFDIDLDAVQREIDKEQIDGGYMSGLAAMLQASGQMIAAGQPQAALSIFTAAKQIIEGRESGAELKDLFVDAFTTAFAPPPGAGGPAGPGAGGGAPGADDGLQGVGPDGLLQGVAPGQAGMAPGGRPSVTDLVSGFNSAGSPNMGANVRRRIPTG